VFVFEITVTSCKHKWRYRIACRSCNTIY